MSGSTLVAPLTTRETVCWETPASRATSDIRAALDLEARRSPRPLEFRASEGAGVVDTIPLSPAPPDPPRKATPVGAPAVTGADTAGLRDADRTATPPPPPCTYGSCNCRPWWRPATEAHRSQ